VTEDDSRGRRRAAALRLKHDLGKYVRLGAPQTREADTEALRTRLRLDLGATRRSQGSARSAPQVFDAWCADEREAFDAEDPDLETLERAVSRLAELLPRIDTLDARHLAELDEISVEIARRCRSLAARSSS
jgi:hypothetical protein